jgi:hypothetical protein
MAKNCEIALRLPTGPADRSVHRYGSPTPPIPIWFENSNSNRPLKLSDPKWER